MHYIRGRLHPLASLYHLRAWPSLNGGLIQNHLDVCSKGGDILNHPTLGFTLFVERSDCEATTNDFFLNLNLGEGQFKNIIHFSIHREVSVIPATKPLGNGTPQRDFAKSGRVPLM